jgi:hypothetical protein
VISIKKENGIMIIEDDNRIIACSSSHTLEKQIESGFMRLTFNAYNFEFNESDIKFEDVIKMFPK